MRLLFVCIIYVYYFLPVFCDLVILFGCILFTCSFYAIIVQSNNNELFVSTLNTLFGVVPINDVRFYFYDISLARCSMLLIVLVLLLDATVYCIELITIIAILSEQLLLLTTVFHDFIILEQYIVRSSALLGTVPTFLPSLFHIKLLL